MEHCEPSLWDNIPLENGCRYLANLDFDEAIEEFNQALQFSLGKQDFIEVHIAACRYWQKRVRMPSPGILEGKRYISCFLTDYVEYSFEPGMMSFKRSLLEHLADFISDDSHADWKIVESLFDLMLNAKAYTKAKLLIAKFLKHQPENHRLLFFLAQAQWFSGSRGEANKNYALALIHHPDKEMIRRIENQQLRELVSFHGPEISPAFGWLSGILPMASLEDEILILGEEHQRAIQSYKFLQGAHKSLKYGEYKSCTFYRKQLKENSPALYKAYFELLESRR